MCVRRRLHIIFISSMFVVYSGQHLLAANNGIENIKLATLLNCFHLHLRISIARLASKNVAINSVREIQFTVQTERGKQTHRWNPCYKLTISVSVFFPLRTTDFRFPTMKMMNVRGCNIELIVYSFYLNSIRSK